MRILLTGGTGFIGHEVAQQLAGSGHHVRALVRRPTRAPLIAHLGHELVHGDLESPASLGRAVRGMDAVIHLAGRATFEPYDRLAETLVDGTVTLARLAADAGVRHFAFGSSAFVYRGDGQHIDLDTRPDPRLDYGRAKVAAESELQSISARTEMSVAALRLPHVYGSQSLLFGMVRRRLVPFPGDGSNQFAQLHVVDAARALIAATETGWAGAAPIAAGTAPTWNDFFDVLETYAPRVRVIRVPSVVAGAGAAVAGPILGRLGPTMVSRDTITGWGMDLDIDAAETWRALDLDPIHDDVSSGIPATLDDVVAFRWRHPINDWS